MTGGMGITQTQYDKLQHMKADFQPGAAISIAVKRGADGKLAFASTTPAAVALTDVTFPPDEKVAETPIGKLAIFNTIHQTDANAPIGVWTGAEWAKVEENGADLPSAKIAFGKREPSGEGRDVLSGRGLQGSRRAIPSSSSTSSTSPPPPRRKAMALGRMARVDDPWKDA